MGAHSKAGKSCQQIEDSALGPEDGSVPANTKPTRTVLRIRVNIQEAGTLQKKKIQEAGTLQKKMIQEAGTLHKKKIRKAGKQNKEGAREVVSSDRSLGGASDAGMRAHHVSNGELWKIQDVADSAVVGDPRNSENKDGDDKMAEKPPTCPECRKIFPSFKALYGHMRVHPPFKAKKSKLEIGAGSSSDKVLTAGRDDEGILDSEDPVANAARILMAMSRSNSPRPAPKLRQETDRLQYRKRQCKLDDLMGEEDMQGKELEPKDAMHSENADVKASRSPLVLNEEVKKKKKKKKKKIKDLESVHEAKPPTQGGGYYRSICNESLSTHQALGDHRATHNKDKNNSEDVDGIGDGNLNKAEELVESKNPVPGGATTQHRCTICQATFPTGQALGGHKRKHWNGPATTPPSRPAPSPATLSESEQKGNNMPLDIDLNELPKLEAEGP